MKKIRIKTERMEVEAQDVADRVALAAIAAATLLVLVGIAVGLWAV